MSEQQVETSGRGCMVAFGILSIFAGMAAIGSPFLTGALVTTIIGISLLVGGVMELLVAFSAGGWKKGVWAFLSGLLAMVAGGLVIAHPVVGAAMIGIILIVFFLMDGITRSILAFQLKPMPGWGWQLFSGVISVALGIMLWQGWPLSGMWAIGVLIGIRILFAGFGILFLTSAAVAVEKTIEA
jgi:uncharacterized membrane protein HdeD (DUF308 family)